MPTVTVTEVLEMPVVRAARPELLAGRAGLGREVRWVHSGELEDIGPLLRGGDLLLSTGIALPESPEGLRAFAASLHESDVAGLVIELGRRWTTLPTALVEACDAARLPLVSLGRQVRFATLAQAIGERIVDEQLTELREAQRVHDVFTELSVEEAGPARILDAGCGPGHGARRLAELYPDAQVLGLDFAYPMLQAARSHGPWLRRVLKRGRVDHVCADFASMPMPAAEYGMRFLAR